MSSSQQLCELNSFAGKMPGVISVTVPKAMPEESFFNLVHDLRQPLSAIESIAFFLELTVPSDQVQARHYICRLQQLVAEASGRLCTAVKQVREI